MAKVREVYIRSGSYATFDDARQFGRVKMNKEPRYQFGQRGDAVRRMGTDYWGYLYPDESFDQEKFLSFMKRGGRSPHLEIRE